MIEIVEHSTSATSKQSNLHLSGTCSDCRNAPVCKCIDVLTSYKEMLEQSDIPECARVALACTHYLSGPIAKTPVLGGTAPC